jgi:hypothetical protein
VNEQGDYTEEDWNTIYTEGGAGVIPSVFGGQYRRPDYRPHPTTGYAWLCSFVGLFILLPSFIALGIAVRAVVKGNVWGWLAATGAVASIAGFFWLRTLIPTT